MGGVPSKADPSLSPVVIGAGYARAGGVSLQLALEKLLKGAVLHGGTHIMAREDSYCKKWLQALQARRMGDKERVMKLLREVTTGYIACNDIPVVLFIPELMEIYPDTKVILMTREPNDWWKSMSGLLENCDVSYLPYLLLVQPGLRWFPGMIVEWQRICDEMIQPEQPGKYGPQLIEAHNKLVMETVPKKQLLVTSVKDGWKPICELLGKPIPDDPFPRENEAAARDKTAANILRKVLLKWVGLFAAVGGSLYGMAIAYQLT